MAFFKSRTKSNSSAESVNHDAQSMDSLRKQARHRLIGATVLVFIAVVGFPIVFDTKPKDIASDIRIDMPERDAVKPSQPPLAPVPDKAALTQPSVSEAVSEAVSGNEQLDQQDSKIPAKEVPAAGEVNQAIEKKSTSSKPVKADNTKPAPVAPAENTAVAKPAANEKTAERFIVQFGAYSDETKVKDLRFKLEKAGVKTYTHVAQTSEGKRTRVRAGPFVTREEAQKVINKTKSLQSNAVILTI
jgi:DedD protein